MYHIPLILCQVVKTEVLLLPESAHHRGKIILSLKCQHFIKNKLTNLLGKTFWTERSQECLGLPPQIQPAVGKNRVLAFSSPWDHTEVSELVLFLSHTFHTSHYQSDRIVAISFCDKECHFFSHHYCCLTRHNSCRSYEQASFFVQIFHWKVLKLINE